MALRFIELEYLKATGGVTAEDCAKTHPGFKIICEKCGADTVYVESSLGFSPGSGAWGEIALVCAKCGQTSNIVET